MIELGVELIVIAGCLASYMLGRFHGLRDGIGRRS